MKAKVVTNQLWQTRTGALITAFLTAGLTYIVALRAIDTGSLGQYFVTFILLLIALNRFILGVQSKDKQHG